MRLEEKVKVLENPEPVEEWQISWSSLSVQKGTFSLKRKLRRKLRVAKVDLKKHEERFFIRFWQLLETTKGLQKVIIFAVFKVFFYFYCNIRRICWNELCVWMQHTQKNTKLCACLQNQFCALLLTPSLFHFYLSSKVEKRKDICIVGTLPTSVLAQSSNFV